MSEAKYSSMLHMRDKLMPLYEVSCERCKETKTTVSAENRLVGAQQLYDKGWRDEGGVLLCPECT